IKIGDCQIEALIDTGAALSLLLSTEAPQSKAVGHEIVQGIEGQKMALKKTLPLLVKIGDHQISHQFVCSPSCPIALLGRVILTKLQAEISFSNGTIEVRLPKQQTSNYQMALLSAKNTEYQSTEGGLIPGINPEVWAEKGSVPRARNASPVWIHLKEGSSPIHVRQYPLKLATQIGLKPLILKFVLCGWLREGTSPYNTPIIGVPKPNGQYRLVQDLRQVNKQLEAPFPVVPNPHTILGQIPKTHSWFTVIDLKDAFFSIPLHPDSQKLFAFEWEDPDTHYKAQYLWTVVPQGPTCAPEIFGSQLKRDLAPFLAKHPSCNIVQYCDNLLLSTDSETSCKVQTVKLLNYLGLQGYKVSKEKAQLVKQQVTFLGYHLSKGNRRLGKERIQAILACLQPRNPQELRAFLGLTGFCRLWIPDYGGKAKPLYESLTKEGLLYWKWTREMEKAFRELKTALTQPPALALPDPRKPFTLYVHERNGVAAGVLCQCSGPIWQPIDYYSKLLDPVARGWPACLRAVAATSLLVQEAEKLTLGGETEIVVPHGVSQILGTGAGEKHLNPSRHSRYEIGLLLAPNLTFRAVSSLNPATLLPDPRISQESSPTHDCVEVLQQETKPRPDLSDVPWVKP
uniref:ribonuclease H n=1 Tax=Gopherus evgoodei TaxID=1825980 RepID=A0A8C4VS50_9SAUR